MATEKLKFKIQLYSTWWKDKPKATILISGKEYFPQTAIDSTKENPTLPLPAFLSIEEKDGKTFGKIVELPTDGDIPFEFNKQYFIEFYGYVK